MLSLLLLGVVVPTAAIIPRQCVGNMTQIPAVCCPTPAGFQRPCGGIERGLCLQVDVYKSILTEKFKEQYTYDVRFRWPERVFQYLCKCQSVYWGPDCGQCWYGYEGKNCDRRVTVKRKNLMKMSADEKRQYVEISMKLRELHSDFVIPKLKVNELRWSGEYVNVDPYEMLVYLHLVSGQPDLTLDRERCARLEAKKWNMAHFGEGFPFYHRYFLLWLEREYQRVAERYFGIKQYALPYWDWTNSRICDPCVDDLIGSSTTEIDPITKGYFVSKKSAFGSPRWKVYCQDETNLNNICYPCHIDRSKPSRLVRKFSNLDFPTVDEVIEFLQLPSYKNFSDTCASAEDILEAGWGCMCRWKSRNIMLHTTVHDFITGTLDILASTMYDPIFVLHHVQMDRLFERWRRGFQPSTRELHENLKCPAQCRDCNIPVFLPPVKYGDMFVDVRQLGYTYDNYDFGSLSEKVRISHWNRSYYKKTCPRWTLKQSKSINKNAAVTCLLKPALC